MVDRPDVAALLVDHDQRAAVTRLLQRSCQASPCGTVTAVRAEQDHARGLARPQAPADVLGASGAREARDRDLSDLLAEREAVDGLAGSGRNPDIQSLGVQVGLLVRLSQNRDREVQIDD